MTQGTTHSPHRICMLVTTNVTDDPRVMKEGSALAEVGYQVIAIGARRTDDQPLYEVVQGISVEREDFWHFRFSRWIKSLRGVDPTQGVFGDEIYKLHTSRRTVRQWVAWVIHQIQYLIHIITVLIVFYLRAVRENAALYHAHDIDTLLPALFAGWTLRRPVIFDSHELWYQKRMSQPFAHWLICTIERFALPRCQGVITSSPIFAEHIVARYQVPQPTLVMNVPIFSSGSPPIPLLDDQTVEILYHGGYMRGRGIELLVAAMQFVQSNAHLTLRGFGDIEQALRRQVETLGLQSRITFVPPVPMNQLVEAARNCHIGVIPYTPESGLELALPNKTFEYMAAGLAVLSSNLPAVGNVIETYRAGQVYDTEDPKLIGHIIDEMATDRHRLQEFRQNAWATYHQAFTWKQHRHHLFQLYDKLGVTMPREVLAH